MYTTNPVAKHVHRHMRRLFENSVDDLKDASVAKLVWNPRLRRGFATKRRFSIRADRAESLNSPGETMVLEGNGERAVLRNLQTVLGESKPVNNLPRFAGVLRVFHRNGVFRGLEKRVKLANFSRQTRVFRGAPKTGELKNLSQTRGIRTVPE
jgi:hypothetical protein